MKWFMIIIVLLQHILCLLYCKIKYQNHLQCAQDNITFNLDLSTAFIEIQNFK